MFLPTVTQAETQLLLYLYVQYVLILAWWVCAFVWYEHQKEISCWNHSDSVNKLMNECWCLDKSLAYGSAVFVETGQAL